MPDQTFTAGKDKLAALRDNIESVFYGKRDVVNQVIIGLLARGHVLIEDVPGIGKTVLARALARSVDCHFARIQLTPDLLPSDILGVSIYDQNRREFEFKRGPIFANIVLADEINRTTPRTQSSLLEAMNEQQVTIDNKSWPLESPFMVVATQNPFEFEGTYFLPENQLDRFTLRVRIGYPDPDAERDILRNRPSMSRLDKLGPVIRRDEVVSLQETVAAVRVDDALVRYILDLVQASREHDNLSAGVSPRGALSLQTVAQAAAMIAGRDYVIPDDVKQHAVAVCAHRVIPKTHVQNGRGDAAEIIINEILDHTPVPK